MKIHSETFRAAVVGGAASLLFAALLSTGAAAQDTKTTATPAAPPTEMLLPSATLSPVAAQPAEQQTLDAIVADLIAQTQQAPATQTVEAALNQALRATAEAQMQTTATVQAALSGALTATAVESNPAAAPFDASSLEVVNVIETELRAGPGNTAAYLSPDGQHFVYIQRDEMCVYDSNAVEQRCSTLPDRVRIDHEVLNWSPDSRYVTFTEEFFRMFRDPDIWVMDTTNGRFMNLTDDGGNDVSILEENWSSVDVVPRWLPDNRIAFIRYSREDGTILQPEIFVVGLDGSAAERLGAVATTEPYPVFATDISNNGALLVYNHGSPSESARNGAWISEIDGGSPRRVVSADRDFMVTTVDLSPDGRYLLTISGAALARFDSSRPAQAVRVTDLQTGAVTVLDEDVFIRSAGWSPTGSALAYVVTDMIEPENAGLFITDVPTEPGRQVLSGNFIVPTPRQQQTILWSSANTMLLSEAPEFNLRVVQLG